MKLVLKILALPVLFVVKVICVLGNLLTNVVSYVIGILLLIIGGSAIYCIVKALWQSLLILVVLGHKIISEKSHRPVAFSFWGGSDGNGSNKIDCAPCE